MTADNVQSELEKKPFVPFRLHLASGKTVDVLTARSAFMLRHALMILHDPRRATESGYNMVAIRNIEMLEQLLIGGSKRERGDRHE